MTRPIDMFRPVLGLGVHRPAAMGRVFYVDTYGARVSDSNEGTDPDHPLSTLQAGIDKCTDDQGDYVIVLDCYEADTEPILLNSGCCHVIGLSLPSSAGYTALNGGGTDLFRISANYVELAGFTMISASADGIHFYSNIGYAWIHHCNFATNAASLVNAIEADSTYGTHSMIEDNCFGFEAGNITGDGITGGLCQSVIRRNTFRNIAGTCLNLTCTTNAGGEIYGNYFYAAIASAEAKGWAIKLPLNSDGWLVMDNYASQTGDATGNNPFTDASTGTLATCMNGWSHNYAGVTIQVPKHD